MAKEDPDHFEDEDALADSITDSEEPGRKTKISEYSARYINERVRKVLGKETTVFGQDLAHHLEFEQMIKSPDDEDTATQKKMSQGLRKARKNLLKEVRTQLKDAISKVPFQRDNEFYLDGVYNFMEQVRFYPRLKKKLAEKRPNQDKILLDDLIEFYSNNTDEIPDDILERMIEHHNRGIKHRAEEREKTLQEYTEKCKQQVKSTAKSLNWPISEDQIDKRFKEVSVNFVDSIIADLEEIGGRFNHRNAAIGLANHLRGTRLYKVLVHEILHAISGQTIMAETNELPKYMEELDDVEASRIGIGVYNRFQWLNESLTEKLTEICLKDNEEEYSLPSYKQERELFELLKTAGSKEIPESLFIEAYFENYDTKARDSGKTTIPKWRELTKAINEAYEPGFLVKVDKYVKQHGVEKTLEVMQKDWRSISS